MPTMTTTVTMYTYMVPHFSDFDCKVVAMMHMFMFMSTSTSDIGNDVDFDFDGSGDRLSEPS